MKRTGLSGLARDLVLTFDRYLSDCINERAERTCRNGNEADRARELEECVIGNDTRPTDLREKKRIQHPRHRSNKPD